jgi:hypothetical protein
MLLGHGLFDNFFIIAHGSTSFRIVIKLQTVSQSRRNTKKVNVSETHPSNSKRNSHKDKTDDNHGD